MPQAVFKLQILAAASNQFCFGEKKKQFKLFASNFFFAVIQVQYDAEIRCSKSGRNFVQSKLYHATLLLSFFC